MGPLLGMLVAGGASSILGGAGGGGGFMGGLMNSLTQGGGLGGLLSSLFGGGQQAPGAAGAGRGNDQTNQLLGDIKDMLSQLLDKEGGAGGAGGSAGGGDCAGGSHGAGPGGGCQKPGGDDGHGCSTKPPSCDDSHGSGGADDDHGCDDADEPTCGGDDHGCDGVDDPEWDGANKSPSLDRERGAARLLEQAKNTDDPGEKRELIDMAMEMLDGGMKEIGGKFGRIIEKRDGNSYDKDIVKQADKMLDQIDEGHLSDCNESKALDSVIDMLMEEGGVDGKPASSDTNGDGWRDPVFRGFGDVIGNPISHHHHLHSALFDDR